MTHCEVCGKPDAEMPMCFRGTGRCSVLCQKAGNDQDDPPTPESEPSCAT